MKHRFDYIQIVVTSNVWSIKQFISNMINQYYAYCTQTSTLSDFICIMIPRRMKVRSWTEMMTSMIPYISALSNGSWQYRSERLWKWCHWYVIHRNKTANTWPTRDHRWETMKRSDYSLGYITTMKAVGIYLEILFSFERNISVNFHYSTKCN